MVLPRHRIRGLNPLNVALVAVVLAIAVGAYFLFFQSSSQAASTTRPTVAVARGDVTASVSSSGTLQSGQSASPQFETSGTVTAILVKVGQTVKKGAALARIDSTDAARQVRIAQQNQIAAANSVTAAEETLTEAEDAAASPTPTPTTGQSQGQNQVVSVTSATASLAKARADKEQADADLESANAAVTATTLRAPIAGTITAINGSVGSASGSSGSSGSGTGSSSGSSTGGSTTGGSSSSSSSSTTTTTAATGGFIDIANLKAMQVVASFAEADAVKIKVKEAATVVLNADPNTNLAATLTSISPTPVTSNGVVSYSAYFAVQNIPAGTRMGQTANVTVQTAKVTNALYVPSTAVTSTGGTYSVTLPNGGGTKQVQIGVRGDSFTQITSGLKEGDKVELIQGPIGGGTGAGGAGQGAGAGRTGQAPGGPGGGFPGGGGGGGGANRGN
jgi:macrolide-specific efflux system membrane fusion protein